MVSSALQITQRPEVGRMEWSWQQSNRYQIDLGILNPLMCAAEFLKTLNQIDCKLLVIYKLKAVSKQLASIGKQQLKTYRAAIRS